MKTLICAVVGLSILSLCGIAPARSAWAEDTTDYICPALKDPVTYQGDKKSYQMIVQGKDGWVFRSRKDFKEDFSVKPESFSLFQALNVAFKKKNVDLIILMPPTRTVVHPSVMPPVGQGDISPFDVEKATRSYNDFVAAFNAGGIRAPSFADVLPLDPAKTQFFYRRDHHWVPPGAALAAEKTAALIKTLPVYASFPVQKFVTSETGRKVAPDGSFARLMGKICKRDMPPELVPEIVTVPEVEPASGDAAGALFGDGVRPGVALVGTSNFVEPAPSFANFAGAMRQALSTEVENLSMGGAGMDSPMISYLNSGHLGEHRVVVWEIATHYDFNSKDVRNMMREVIPAAQGRCADEAAVARFSIPAAPQGRLTAFKDLQTQMGDDSAYFAAIRSAAKIKEPVVMTTVYKPESQTKDDVYNFTRDERYPHDGIYFLSLKQTKKRRIDSILLDLPQDAVGHKIDINICKLEP